MSNFRTELRIPSAPTTRSAIDLAAYFKVTVSPSTSTHPLDVPTNLRPQALPCAQVRICLCRGRIHAIFHLPTSTFHTCFWKLLPYPSPFAYLVQSSPAYRVRRGHASRLQLELLRLYRHQ
jgi:hypothetical protein